VKYCLDTDVLSATIRPNPPLHVMRRLAHVPREQQHTTAINLGELLYGAAKRGSPELAASIREVIVTGVRILPFDRAAAEVYGSLRARLEREGRGLAEPDLRIAAIAVSRDLTLVTGNTRHFERVPGLRVENWLAPAT
jgi:tRNA(fMet)-specific endonuclease VapC